MEEDGRDLCTIVRNILGKSHRRHVDDATLRRALLAGYPDRVAVRRGSGVLLSSGTGAPRAREIDDARTAVRAVLEITGELSPMPPPSQHKWLTPHRPAHAQHSDRPHQPRSH